ncbi:hypothetical protein SAY86_002529 [Trapa natans]|uniref:Uncharacterized protein n=1 Tax=Trapa natans TaxID=22666 RepID=A0AAN7R2J2_TRANT|nr:hypothetical protein SAY86_002529 [Trapa natans]
MEATATSFPFSASLPKSSSSRRRSTSSPRVLALRRGGNHRPDRGGSRIVDEGMVVLRMRIREMKQMEKSYEAPIEWMGWERSHYEQYNSLVCEIVGLLQNQLMNTRPGLVIGALALILFSVASSSATLLIHAAGIAQWISSSLHGTV